jgi:hypothetical protein
MALSSTLRPPEDFLPVHKSSPTKSLKTGLLKGGESHQNHIDLAEGVEAGPSWRLTGRGFARIASLIREAENDALERAAELCEAVHLGRRTRYSMLLGPDYLVTRSLLSRELAAAIRALKHTSSEF